jgi:hypothetical protein
MIWRIAGHSTQLTAEAGSSGSSGTRSMSHLMGDGIESFDKPWRTYARRYRRGACIMRARSIVAKTNADDLHRDYEMFNIERTHHVLAVNDIETSERYFIDKLGFELRSRVDGW